MKELIKKLAVIQQKLNAPKNQYNSFGKYKYRNVEDIQEAVKPLLGELVLYITDEIVLVGERYYVKATATITDGDNTLSNHAYAREELSKKGMDSSQLTGSTSSYARKYALGGLLMIDDSKDADSQDNSVDNRSELQKLIDAGNEKALAAKWRGLDQDAQQLEWSKLAKPYQDKLKEQLAKA